MGNNIGLMDSFDNSVLKYRIKKILRESLNLKNNLIQQINSKGLFFILKITGLSYTKLFSMGIGPEYLTRKVKQEFIQDYFKNLGYGIGLSEIDVEPIMYSNNDEELKEIVYISSSKVTVEVWDWETESVEGEFGVSYHNLNDNFIDIIFDIVVQLYDNNTEI